MLTSTVLLVNSLTILLSTYVTSFYGQAAFAVVFGFTIGAVSSSTMVTLKVISKDHVTNSLGIYMLVAASASLIGPKIVGEIFDAHQDYRIGFLVVWVPRPAGSSHLRNNSLHHQNQTTHLRHPIRTRQPTWVILSEPDNKID